MPIDVPIEPLVEDDEELRRLLAVAELPALLATLAQITGDMSMVADDVRPPRRDKHTLIEPQGGMSPAQQQLARERALDGLKQFRDSRRVPREQPSSEMLRRLLTFVTGEQVPEYEPLLLQELGMNPEVVRPRWSKAGPAPDREFSVIVIGAGMSGLAAAHYLDRVGIPFVVLERNEDVGGVWLENTYPGCRLDTNNFAYSYSYAQKEDWPQQYSRQPTILDYFSDVADELDLRRRICFATEVVSASFDDDTSTWSVTTRDREGTESVLIAQAVISAVGQLNQPSYPDVPGRERFVGPSFHSARWDPSVELSGRRVAVIGTGASAYQVIPSIADEVGELTVFQRTPPWALPAPNYHDDIAPGLQRLFRTVPYYARWFRFYQYWLAVDGMHAFAVVDPEWDEPGSVSAANEMLRAALATHIEKQYVDRPDLLKKVLPSYPPYAKRMLRDNGVWAETLKKDHVSLVSDGIAEIDERGIRTRDGEHYEADVIIYGTGFTASDFLSTIKVTGRGGVDLHEQWDGDARAYLGITIPNFPNLFCLYGPNTNLVLNGSTIMFSELGAHYIMECLCVLLSTGRRTIEVRQEVFEAFNDRIDRANRAMAWSLPHIHSWYKNATGRVSQNWPLPTLDYWRLTRELDRSEYWIT